MITPRAHRSACALSLTDQARQHCIPLRLAPRATSHLVCPPLWAVASDLIGKGRGQVGLASRTRLHPCYKILFLRTLKKGFTLQKSIFEQFRNWKIFLFPSAKNILKSACRKCRRPSNCARETGKPRRFSRWSPAHHFRRKLAALSCQLRRRSCPGSYFLKYSHLHAKFFCRQQVSRMAPPTVPRFFPPCMPHSTLTPLTLT
jgi:hypothetical protein